MLKHNASSTVILQTSLSAKVTNLKLTSYIFGNLRFQFSTYHTEKNSEISESVILHGDDTGNVHFFSLNPLISDKESKLFINIKDYVQNIILTRRNLNNTQNPLDTLIIVGYILLIQ